MVVGFKETKDTHVRSETVSFVALSGADFEQIKEPDGKLAQRNNVGKAHYAEWDVGFGVGSGMAALRFPMKESGLKLRFYA